MTYRVTFPQTTYDVEAESPYCAVQAAQALQAQDVRDGVIMPLCKLDEPARHAPSELEHGADANG